MAVTAVTTVTVFLGMYFVRNPRKSLYLRTAEKSRGWLQFGRFFDRMHRSDENYHFKKLSGSIGLKKNNAEKFSAPVASDEGSVACASREKNMFLVTSCPSGIFFWDELVWRVSLLRAAPNR